MISGWRIEGHAIVSVDDCIAGVDGTTPAGLHNDADWARFQAALDDAAVTALGRRAHEANPNPKGRNRLVLSSSASGVERRTDGWWWNPAEVSLADALAESAPRGGIVAVPGGRLVFDYFLGAGFDAFHLARHRRVSIAGGVPIFSAVGAGKNADAILAGHGLVAGPVEILDDEADVALTVWRRPGALDRPRNSGDSRAMSDPIEPADVFRTIRFFAEVLDDAEVDMLAAHAHFTRFPAGARPIEEGAPGSAMFVIASGEAVVSVRDEGGDEEIARLGKGDIVGEMSLLTGARRSATVTAATPLEMIEVSKLALAHVLGHSPGLVDRFAALLDRRQKELDRLAGGSAWGMLRLGKAEMAATIRDFYQRTR